MAILGLLQLCKYVMHQWWFHADWQSVTAELTPRAASFGPPSVSCVLAIARTCIRQAPPTFRGRGLATSAVTDCMSAWNHHQCITYLHNCKSPRIAITALWGLYILKSKCQRQEYNENSLIVTRLWQFLLTLAIFRSAKYRRLNYFVIFVEL